MQFNFKLVDEKNEEIGVTIVPEGMVNGCAEGFSIRFDGHGTNESVEDGPVYIEYREGEVKLCVWGDVSNPDITDVINLSKARLAEPECIHE